MLQRRWRHPPRWTLPASSLWRRTRRPRSWRRPPRPLARMLLQQRRQQQAPQTSPARPCTLLRSSAASPRRCCSLTPARSLPPKGPLPPETRRRSLRDGCSSARLAAVLATKAPAQVRLEQHPYPIYPPCARSSAGSSGRSKRSCVRTTCETWAPLPPLHPHPPPHPLPRRRGRKQWHRGRRSPSTAAAWLQEGEKRPPRHCRLSRTTAAPSSTGRRPSPTSPRTPGSLLRRPVSRFCAPSPPAGPRSRHI